MINPPALKTIAILAEIPVFDWHGPEFLLFYAVSFGVALIWSLIRRSQSMRAFDAGRAQQAQPSDPYEIAFLAGGPHRCGQLAVSRLLQSGDLKWRAGRLLQSGRLLSQKKAGGRSTKSKTHCCQVHRLPMTVEFRFPQSLRW